MGVFLHPHHKSDEISTRVEEVIAGRTKIYQGGKPEDDFHEERIHLEDGQRLPTASTQRSQPSWVKGHDKKAPFVEGLLGRNVCLNDGREARGTTYNCINAVY